MGANGLRVGRAERGVSQLWTATTAGISAGRYWRIEHQLAEPTAEERAAIAWALEMPEDELWPQLATEGQDPALGGDGLTRALA